MTWLTGHKLNERSAQRDTNTANPPQSPHRLTEFAMAVVGDVKSLTIASMSNF